MYAAILAGGVGTRLWPRSRQSQPKQFSDITGAGRTMIQITVDRLEGLVPPDQTYVITGSRYASLVGEQLQHIPSKNILVEPSGRNTAPAIGLACIHLQRRDPEAVVAILSADHSIRDEDQFRAVLRQAEIAAQAGHLVILGIEPDTPHTGYGYIKRKERLAVSGELPVYAVEKFLEKPNQPTAQRFLAEGGYYWNGGTFVSRVDRLLEEMAQHMPDLYAKLRKIQAALGSDEAGRVLDEVWPTVPKTSIDYGVMERAQQVAVVPLRAGWNDVGSWDALEKVSEMDAEGNCTVAGQTLSIDSQGNIVSGDSRLIALIGVEDLVVVDTGDALLIGHKKQMQKVKAVVEQLRNEGKIHLL